MAINSDSHVFKMIYPEKRYSGQQFALYQPESSEEPPHDKTNQMTVRPAKTSLSIRPV